MVLWRMLGQPELVREPRFDSLFYPSQKTELAELIAGALGEGPADARAIIVPHSDLRLVAEVVGAGFSRLARARRVVVLGPSHKVPFAGVAVPNADGWRTPLGTSRIDVKAFKSLEPMQIVRVLDPVFDAEPAAELLVPWIQTTHPRAMLIGMLAGDVRALQLRDVLSMLDDGDTVFVVASELGRDLGERDLVRQDEQTLAQIERLDSKGLTSDHLTARSAVTALIDYAGDRGWRAERVLHRTSRELGARDERTAGFAAIAFSPVAFGRGTP